MKTIGTTMLTLLLTVCLFVTAACPVSAAVQYENVWDNGGQTMSAAEAQAYLQVIYNAQDKAAREEVDELYVTLLHADGNVMLWVAGIDRFDDWSGPGSVEGTEGYITTRFEEIWEWDGTRAVEFATVSEYGADVNLYPEGLEVFIYKHSTDVSGSEWDAMYPIENGRIVKEPQWCYAWAWINEYDLEQVGLYFGNQGQREIAEAFFDAKMRQDWPKLPLEKQRLVIGHEMGERFFYASIQGGEGYDAFMSDKGDQPYRLHVTDALQNAASIASGNDEWITGEEAIDRLNAYAKETPMTESAATLPTVSDENKTTSAIGGDTPVDTIGAMMTQTDRGGLILGLSIAAGVLAVVLIVLVILLKTRKR
ncbi:MAG: hypothetical protein IJB27_06725 [Clostridia bacterium]|nr:hypothetical protein [Clostridia bacterium]